LVKLFDQIERPVVDRMPGHFGELHFAEYFDAVGLRADQLADRLGCALGRSSGPFKQRVNFSHGEDGHLHTDSVT
jgi:hypothetical protein